ncbi:hypothetical protein [Paenibacillus sp. yr247]|uniref:hypothetical protein n=1 Tax=Paenibacillus sp. yr247 TaxID=1761880 RepID=UPI000B87E6CC|nr:hypothetical protein [Paenibacillus sp. yr247]
MKGITSAKAVFISGNFVFVLTQDGAVHWAIVYNEVMGRMRTEDELRIKTLTPLTKIKSIAASWNNLFMMQQNGRINRNQPVLKPKQVKGLSHITMIAGGSFRLHFAIKKQVPPFHGESHMKAGWEMVPVIYIVGTPKLNLC